MNNRIPLPAARPTLIGMCHVPALPGSPRFGGIVAAVREWVVRDAIALRDGGADAILIENFGDVPFYPDRVPAHVVAHLAVIADAVRRESGLPVGINVLRNDGRSALAIASAVAAAFIRVNVLSHARVTDQGVLQAIAHEVQRDRLLLSAQDIRVFADVSVKESVPLAAGLSLEDEVDDVLHRGLADGVIVSGANTGGAVNVDDLRRARAAAGDGLVLVGSGVTAENARELLKHADALIVGSWLKVDGRVENPVDASRVRALVAAMRGTI
jgi:uncharacterized protein